MQQLRLEFQFLTLVLLSTIGFMEAQSNDQVSTGDIGCDLASGHGISEETFDAVRERYYKIRKSDLDSVFEYIKSIQGPDGKISHYFNVSNKEKVELVAEMACNGEIEELFLIME